MKLYSTMAVLAAVLSLGACSSERRSAEQAVREGLKDPDSARFGEFYYNNKTKKACLATNAKNSMGGYTGDQQAYLKRTESGWEFDGIADVPQDLLPPRVR